VATRRSSTRRAPTALGPVDRQPLGQVVAQRVLGLIRDEKLETGAKLPSEHELMAQLGVGRSSVREALNGLALMGVIEIRHGQGGCGLGPAPDIAPEALSRSLRKGVTGDLLEARETLELSTVRLAARRATDEDLDELRRCVIAAQTAHAADEPLAPHSAEFHVLIAQASHNDVLREMLGLLSGALVDRGPALERLPGYRAWETAEHAALLEAVTARDEELAVERMRRHLAAMAEHLRRAE
jgi:GntR family transcriptional repressor for pyruvate dehydrogenase complex